MVQATKILKAPLPRFSQETEGRYKLFYVQPDTELCYLTSPEVAGQRIYNKLAALKLHKHEKQFNNLIVLAPESTFPFPLNDSNGVLDLWSYVLPKNAHFLIGSQRAEGRKLYQTVYHIQGNRITETYDKLHRTPVSENLPRFYKNKDFFTRIFLRDKRTINKGKGVGALFCIGGLIYIMPQICSDLLLGPLPKIPVETEVIFWFVNDSWFIGPMKKWIKAITILRTTTLGIPVVYIAQ
jgi:apolipoprotein N-acyltransferase